MIKFPIFCFIILLALFSFLFLPIEVSAQVEWLEWLQVGSVLKIIFGPQIPEEWLRPFNILQFLIAPFILLWLVFFGILTEIRIFRRYPAINGFIALFFALMASYTGALVMFIHWTTMAVGWYGYIVFLILLVCGIFAWAVLRLRAWGFRRWGFTAEIMEKETKLVEWRDYLRRCLEAGLTEEVEVARKKIEELEKELSDLRKKKLPGERPG